MTGSAQSAVGIAEQTAAAAGDGNQAVASAVQQMKTIEEAVNAMEQGTKEVVMGGQVVAAVGRAFENIVDLVGNDKMQSDIMMRLHIV